MLKTYQGSCHCGAVRFEADIDLAQGTGKCNCSICTKTRNWSVNVKPDKFRLLSGADALSTYRFSSKQAEHLFCKHCGVRSFGIGNAPDTDRVYGINLGCLEDVTPEELAAAPIIYVDGKHDNWQSAPAITTYL